MTISAKTGSIVALALLIIGSIVYFNFNHQKVNDSTVVTPTSQPVSPTLSPIESPKAQESPSKYLPEMRAKIRETFITNCQNKVGQQYTAQCNCGADYLAAHYSESELAKIYVQYHSSSKIPAAVQAAYDACNK